MGERPTKIPATRPPQNDSTKEIMRVVTNIAEAVDVRLGRRGDPIDRAITLRELIDSGLAKKLVSRPFDPNNPGGDFIAGGPVLWPTRPPAPTGVVGSAGFRTNTIFWDQPVYGGHSLAEIWRFDADTLGDAILIGTSPGTAFTDTVAGGSTYYYWVRFVNASSIYGDFHSTSGVALTTAPDVTLLLDLLTGAIRTSELVGSLQTTINLITASSATAGSVNERIATASAALQGQIDDLLSIPAYDNAASYVLDDQVVYLGSLYRALGATTGNLPTNPTYWELIGDYTSIGAVVAANSADIAQLNFVDVGSTSATAAALAGLQATVNHATTGLPATRALLLTDYSTTATTTSAIASAVTGLVSTTALNTALGAYTTTALLTTNYYTKTEADTAISVATTNLVSNTSLASTLGSYVTNSALTSSYYTSSQTDTAISNATLNLVSNTSLATTLGSYATNASLTTNYTTTTGMNSAISSATSALSASIALDYATYAALELNYFTKADGEALEGQYTVKIDINGRVAGFGLANTSVSYDGGIHSEFAVLADRFAIVNTGTNVEVVPFIVTTIPTTLNGVSVPAGVYIEEAFIKNGAIANAKIGNLAVDNAKIADLAVNTAKISDLAVSEAKIQNAAVTNAKIQNAAVTNAKIQDAAITSAKIQDLSVDTIKITGNAVSQTAFASSGGSSTSLPLSLTARNGTVMIWATFYPNSIGARWYYIKRNGTIIKSAYLSVVTSPIFMVADAPGSGSVTYTAECSVTANLIEMQILEVLR